MRRVSVLFALFLSFAEISLGAAAPEVPAPPAADFPVLVPVNYASDEAAPAAWKPMNGTAPVSVVQLAGRKVLRLPCNFAGTKFERASWDLDVSLDLVACEGIQFQLFCADASPVSHFSIYFESGKGWYAATFHPAANAGWETITVSKSDTTLEGSPAGWGKVSRVRLSAWRGQNTDTALYLADLGLRGADAPIVVVRADSAAAASPGEARAITQYAQGVAEALKALQLPHFVMSDRDLTAARLHGRRLAILPHNPSLPPEAVEALAQYLRGGGKLLAFYDLPAGLAPLIGIESGPHAAQKYPGHFSSIRFVDQTLRGAPPAVVQRSWNINAAKPAGDKARVIAEWFDDKGQTTGLPAVILSDNALFMTHVLLEDGAADKRQLLLAMAGHFLPQIWKQTAQAGIAGIGKVGPHVRLEDVFDEIQRRAVEDPRLLGRIDQITKIEDEAIALTSAEKYPEAVAKAQQARTLLLETYLMAQKPQPNEHRAWWCHSAFGVAGMTWDEAIKNLADNGFNAIHPNMLWGGVAFYESKVLPVAPEIKEKGDQIAQCVAACRKYGVECHVWKVNWNMGSRTPKEFVTEMRKAGRTQVRFDGTPEERWLCPSNPLNQKLEIDSMVEVASKYDVDGIHFDYIRYPGDQTCFCDTCRRNFEEFAGAKVKNWPADVRKDEKLHEKWNDFRRSNITMVVAGVNEQARKAKPKIKISAAVFRNWPTDRDGVGQDWKVWCDKGWLDFVCPMDYTESTAEFEKMAGLQRGWAGKVPCYPGIGLSVWKQRDDAGKLVDQINVTRRLQTGGFTVFNYGESEARVVVPLCGKGITRKQ